MLCSLVLLPLWGAAATRAADIEPQVIGTWPRFAGVPCCVVVEQSFAYTTVNRTGLVIFDVSDPGAASLDLQPVGVFAGAPADGLAVEDGRAYLQIAGRLVVSDLSDPAAPRELGGFDGVSDFDVADGLVYSFGGSCLDVIDAREPAAARLLGSLEEPDAFFFAFFFAFFVAGIHAFAGDQLGRFWGLDVSDPARPRRLVREQLEVRPRRASDRRGAGMRERLERVSVSHRALSLGAGDS